MRTECAWCGVVIVPGDDPVSHGICITCYGKQLAKIRAARVKEKKMYIIDLSGPDGNAFHLLGIARRICSKTGQDFDEISERMTSSDYDNLVKIFKEEFSDFVTIVNE